MLFLAAALLAATDPAAPTVAPAQPTQAAETAAPKKPKKICKTEDAGSGSHMVKRLCLTEDEWAQRGQGMINNSRSGYSGSASTEDH